MVTKEIHFPIADPEDAPPMTFCTLKEIRKVVELSKDLPDTSTIRTSVPIMGLGRRELIVSYQPKEGEALND